MQPRFIEIIDTEDRCYLVNVNFITCVEETDIGTLISFVKAGDQSTYGIFTKYTLEQVKASLQG